MHTILWDGAKWNKCEMHQLVTAADVKKSYRRACLAVHPDKVSEIYIVILNITYMFKICYSKLVLLTKKLQN